MGERGSEGEGRDTGWREETERGGGTAQAPGWGVASGREVPPKLAEGDSQRWGGVAYIP